MPSKICKCYDGSSGRKAKDASRLGTRWGACSRESEEQNIGAAGSLGFQGHGSACVKIKMLRHRCIHVYDCPKKATKKDSTGIYPK